MMPASPPPAPNPFRSRKPAPQSPMPVLWLGARNFDAFRPSLGKNWIN